MRRATRVLIGLIVGYGVGVAIGALMIWGVSSNRHDLSLEMAMTAAFVAGPIGALVAAVTAAVCIPRRP